MFEVIMVLQGSPGFPAFTYILHLDKERALNQLLTVNAYRIVLLNQTSKIQCVLHM